MHDHHFVEWMPWVLPIVIGLLIIIVPILTRAVAYRVINRKLYHEDGLAIYVPRIECKKISDQTRKEYCTNVEQVRKDLNENRNLVLQMFTEVKADLNKFDEKREIGQACIQKIALDVAELKAKIKI